MVKQVRALVLWLLVCNRQIFWKMLYFLGPVWMLCVHPLSMYFLPLAEVKNEVSALELPGVSHSLNWIPDSSLDVIYLIPKI